MDSPAGFDRLLPGIGLAEALDASPAVTYVAAADGPPRVLYVSEAVERVLGYRPSLLTGSPAFLMSLVHPLDAGSMADSRARALAGETVVNDRRMRQPDGTYRWIRDTIRLAPAKDGKPAFLIGTIVDVTAEREALAEARERTESYRLLADHSDDLITRIDTEGRFLYQSPAARRVMGFDPEDRLGTDAGFAIHDEDRDALIAAFRTAAKTRTSCRLRYRARHKDGHWVLFEASVNPVPGADGRISEFVIVSREITAQAAAEAKLAETAAALELMLETATDIFARHAPDGRVLYVSPSHQRILGYPPGSNYAGHMERNHPDDLDRIVAAFVSCRETLQPVTCTFRTRHAEGHWVWLEARMSPVVDPESGQAREFVVVSRDVSAKIEAERAAEKAAQQYKLLADNAHDIISRTSAEGKTLYMSPAFERILGRPIEGFLYDGTSLPEDVEAVRRASIAAAKTRQPQRARFRARHRDGHWVWFDASISPVSGEDGRVREFVTVSKDISAQVAAEEAAAAAQAERDAQAEELRLIVTYSSDPITRIDPRGRLTFATHAVRPLLGYDPDEMTGDVRRFVHPEDHAHSAEALREAARTKTPMDYRQRVRARDGRWVWFDVRGTPIFDETGRLTEFVCACREASGTMAAERAAEAALRDYRTLTESNPDIVARYAKGGKLLYRSRAFETITGYTVAEMKGGSARGLIDAEDQIAIDAAEEEAYQTGETQRFRFRLTRKDGARRWLAAQMNPIRDPETGEVTEILSVSRDITEDVEREAELAAAQAESEAARRELETVAANFRTLAEYSADMITRHRTDGTVLYFSPAAQSIVSAGSPGGKLGTDWIHPDDWPAVTEEFVAAATSTQPRRYRFRGRRGGGWGWFETVLSPVAEQGVTRELIANTRQIDAQVAQERALDIANNELKRQARQIRYLSENSSDVIASVGMDGLIRSATGATQHILGITPEEFIAEARNLIHPEDRGRSDAALLDFARQPRLVRIEQRYRHADGHWVWTEARVNPVFDETDGALKGCVATISDITERKKAEADLAGAFASLAAKEHELQQLADNSLDVILRMSAATGTLLFSSKAGERLLGRRFEDSAGKNLSELIWHDDLPEAHRVWQLVLETGRPAKLRHRVLHADGRPLWFDAVLNPIVKNGKVGEVVITSRNIDAEVEAEAKLAEARREADEVRARMQLILDNSVDAVMLMDAGRKPLFISNSVERLTGYSPAEHEALSRSLELIHPDDKDLCRTTIEQETRDGKATQVRYRARHKDGRWLWLERRGATLRDANGAITNFIGVTRDVSEAVAREEALARAYAEVERKERELTFITDNSSDAMSRIGRDGRLNFISGAVKAIQGYDPEELIGQTLDVIHPDDLPAIVGRLERAFAGGPIEPSVYRVRHKAGHWVWVEAQGNPVRDPGSGEVVEVIASVRDVSARRAQEEALAAAQAELQETADLLQLMNDNSTDAVGVMNAGGQVVFVSRAIERLVGFSPEEYLGRRGEYIHPDDLPEIRKAMETSWNACRPYRFRFRTRHKDGRWVWLESRVRPIADPETGQVARAVFINSDIGAQMAHELELESAKIAAESANRAKSQFLATMSHELRTPMTGILGMLDLLRGTGLKPEQEHQIGLAYESAENLLAILNDVLDLSKIEAGQMKIVEEPYELREVVEKVMSLMRPVASKKSLAIAATIDPSLPAGLSGDRTRVRQVLFNLVGNAVKFTGEGAVDVSVRRQESPGGTKLRFEVRDTGPGIPEEAKARLFKAFSQADGTHTRKAGGTGLGLAISKSLVEAMEGRIGFENAPGKGTVFWFDLPLKAAVLPAVQTAAAPSAGPHKARSSLNILVAEDHPVNQQLLKAMLTRDGHRAQIAANGVLAVEAAKAGNFDVILMDIQMPVMDGIAATRAIRGLDLPVRDIPIVAVTANALRGDREVYLSAGMTGYVSKPIKPDALRQALAEAVPDAGAALAV
jgi:PAS domain S-box-containing protein